MTHRLRYRQKSGRAFEKMRSPFGDRISMAGSELLNTRACDHKMQEKIGVFQNYRLFGQD